MDSVKDIRDIIEKNFNIYAKYVITSRALPSALDGLKNSQRKLLWTLYNCKKGIYQKVTKVAGQAMAYYVHGPVSAEKALVALYHKTLPLIDGQGNFGNYILDMPAAAGRYIEARLSEKYKDYLFDNKITTFIDSYDGQSKEPVLLPTKLPLLLCNGAEGIAVGMSTLIFPHAPREVIDAVCKHLSGVSFRKIPLPDFQDSKCKIDATTYKEDGRITCQAIIEKVTDKELKIIGLPPQVKIPKLLDEIEQVNTKYALGITDVGDYTSKDDIRNNRIDLRIKFVNGNYSKVLRALLGDTSCTTTMVSNNIALDKTFKPKEYTIQDLVIEAAEYIAYIFKSIDEKEAANIEEKINSWERFINFYTAVKNNDLDTYTKDELILLAENCGDKELYNTPTYKMTESYVEDLEERKKALVKELNLIHKSLKNKDYKIKAINFLEEVKGNLPKRNCEIVNDDIDDIEVPTIENKLEFYYRTGDVALISPNKTSGLSKIECTPKDKVVVIYDTGEHVQIIADTITSIVYLNSLVDDGNVIDVFVLDEDDEYLVASECGRIARLYFVSKWSNRAYKYFNITDKVIFFTKRPEELKGSIHYLTSKREKKDSLEVYDTISLQKIGSKGTHKYKYGIIDVCLDK